MLEYNYNDKIFEDNFESFQSLETGSLGVGSVHNYFSSIIAIHCNVSFVKTTT